MTPEERLLSLHPDATVQVLPGYEDCVGVRGVDPWGVFWNDPPQVQVTGKTREEAIQNALALVEAR